MSGIKTHWPKIMLGIYLAVFAFFAYKPRYFYLWITENSIAVAAAVFLIVCYFRKIRFSNLSYTLMTAALCCQTIGGHYCFAEVPFDFVTELFGFERNNYDRLGHFMVGFFALPVMEYLESREIVCNRRLNMILVILGIFGAAGIFEIIEWIYAEITYAELGKTFLGSQGDIWDAQKDILCDGLGAIFTAVIFAICYKGKEVSRVIGYRKLV